MNKDGLVKLTRYKAFKTAYFFTAARAPSLLIYTAIFFALAAKLYHAFRTGLYSEYPSWIFADIAVLLSIELSITTVTSRWNNPWVFRAATLIACIVCLWSIANAGWLVRTGTQILPNVFLPLFRSPLNAIGIVGSNLVKMPKSGFAIMVPLFGCFVFLIAILTKPVLPDSAGKSQTLRAAIASVVILLSISGYIISFDHQQPEPLTQELRFNSHLKSVENLFFVSTYDMPPVANYITVLPSDTSVNIVDTARPNKNVIVIVLEGVQYFYTSMSQNNGDTTPFLAALAADGIEFSQMRSTVTHTTKAIFSLMTGRYPSVSQDIAETVPARQQYASLASVLKKSGYRTAFFQSAKGSFEARPSLVYNLGFQNFYAREDIADPNTYLGSLASDEFQYIQPIKKWVSSDTGPFLLVYLCSVTHDPYVVPEWYEPSAATPLERYKQTIRYTDDFLRTLYGELKTMGAMDNTVFCVVGDHGEAFGEHGMLGHERIPFEEALRISWFINAPGIEPEKINSPTASIDLTPTLLSLLGFDISGAQFDGFNALKPIAPERKIYFSGWMLESPAGFVRGTSKNIYNPITDAAYSYDLFADQNELYPQRLDENFSQMIIEDIFDWRADTMFKIDQQQAGQQTVYSKWFLYWKNRVCTAVYND